MILTDEEIEKCRELAFHAAKKSQQSCKGQQVTPSDDYEYQFAWAIEAAILAKLNSAEPVGYEFQATDGKWCQFIDQRHFDNTKANGRWLIRAIYTTPQPDRTAELAELRAALQRPDRAELQAEGKHPAPCAKFCEATAFGIDIRTLKAERDKYKALCDQLGAAMENGYSPLNGYDMNIKAKWDAALAAYRVMK